MFHPATLLLAWAEFAILLAWLPLAALAALLALAGIAAAAYARRRTLALLKRARWLLLALALLFAFDTPGLSVPGPLGSLGMTQDGIFLAADHIARLSLLLATLAMLHEAIGTAGFVTGLHWLLGLLRMAPAMRERIAVRVMLVIEFVEGAAPGSGWRAWLATDDAGPSRLTLATRRTRWQDWLALALLAAGAGSMAC